MGSEFCLIHLCRDNPELAVNMFKGLHATAVILFHLPSTAVKRVILVHSPKKSVRHVCLQIGHSISETEKQASDVSVFNSPLKPRENKQVHGWGPRWRLFSRLAHKELLQEAGPKTCTFPVYHTAVSFQSRSLGIWLTLFHKLFVWP